MNFEKEMLIVFFAIILVWLLVGSRRGKEGFDVTGCKFLPIGEQQYDLRGVPITTESIDTIFLKENPDVRLHYTNNEMYDSNYSPGEEGAEGCVKVPCPCTADNYYKGSPCWKCAGPKRPSRGIPPMFPHVMN